MASKRMFDKAIIDQDSFFDLPMEAKALYFLLGMEADDEGFVNPRKVLRLYGGTDDSIKILIAKGYIIAFESGVIVITDWKRNNYIDKKRMKPTIYIKEKEKLGYDDVSEKYVLNECSTNVKQMLKENSIDKISIDKNSIVYIEDASKDALKKQTKKKYGNYKRILLTDKEYEKLIKDYGKEVIDKQIELLDEYVESNNNKNKYTNFNLVLRKSIRDNWFNKTTKNTPAWFDEKNEIKEKVDKNDEKEFDDLLKSLEN